MVKNMKIYLIEKEGLFFFSKDVKIMDFNDNKYHLLLQKLRIDKFMFCQCCRLFKGRIVHHIDRNRKNNHVNNLILLCKLCHSDKHNPFIYSYSRRDERLVGEGKQRKIIRKYKK